jgi:tetratricopeptide (TPR) repeat protein
LLHTIGEVQIKIASASEAEATLEEAIIAAEAGGDDVDLARSAAGLTYLVGYCDGRVSEGMRWARLANAALDRAGPGHSQIRAWVLTDEAAVFDRERDFQSALDLTQESIALKTEALGENHLDVANSLANAGNILGHLQRWPEALEAVDHALKIIEAHGGRDAETVNMRGEILLALGRLREARDTFDKAVEFEQNDRTLAYPLTGLGRVKIAEGDPKGAVAHLERALRMREAEETDPTFLAETRFALAQALWDSGVDRKRAFSLATEAKEGYAHEHVARELGEVDAWLATHKTKRNPP